MAKITTKAGPSLRGSGGAKMFGKQSVGTQKPGQSAQAGKGGGKFPMGGKTAMFGKQSVKPAKKC